LGGGFLRLFATLLYALEFCCAALILGIYSYFLSILSDRDRPISSWKKAVTGMSGSACLYLVFAILLTCFLGGKSFFALIGIILDILFCAAFIAIAVLARDGADNCSGNVKTPLGNGPSNRHSPGYGANGFGFGEGENTTYEPNLGLACRLNTVAFAVAIIGAFLFFLSALTQIWLARHHKKEKRYGPSPSNNYTSGTGRRRFWNRRRGPKTTRDAEIGAGHKEYRPSHDTAYTGSTVAPGAGYHTGPTGTH
ncbi:hypothetical protein M501DRAFT_901436, partial [Patellaria atrata CBS 101060]